MAIIKTWHNPKLFINDLILIYKMSSFVINIREEDNLENIKYGINMKEDIFISDENYDILN